MLVDARYQPTIRRVVISTSAGAPFFLGRLKYLIVTRLGSVPASHVPSLYTISSRRMSAGAWRGYHGLFVQGSIITRRLQPKRTGRILG